jgi:hypothetical protein
LLRPHATEACLHSNDSIRVPGSLPVEMHA